MAIEEERYGYRKEKQILVVVLVLCGLAFASYVVAQTFYAPSADEVSTSVGTETGGPPAIAPANVSANESNIPKWWYWSEEDWQEFQWYANQTEIIWNYNETGEKIGGTVIVAGEPLLKEYSSGLLGDRDENDAFYGFNSISPVEYLDGKRKGNCGGVAIICYCLFTVKGEEVILTSAQNINYSSDPKFIGKTHVWVEWTDSENNEWAIDLNNVIPLNEWYQRYNWTMNWVQWKPGEYEIHKDGSVIYF